jgi:hypothetical protein
MTFLFLGCSYPMNQRSLDCLFLFGLKRQLLASSDLLLFMPLLKYSNFSVYATLADSLVMSFARGVFGWCHQVEHNGIVPHLELIPVFSWKMEWNEVVPQKRIFPLDPECTHSSKLVESTHSSMLNPPTLTQLLYSLIILFC